MDLVQAPPRRTTRPLLRPGMLHSAVIALFVGGAWILALLNDYPLGAVSFLLSTPVAALVGHLILARHPRNIVGWLIIGHAWCFTLAELSRQYALYGVLTAPGALPLAHAAGWPAYWLWGPAILLQTLLPLYFPTGRLLSPRWRIAVWYAVCTIVAVTLSMAFMRSDNETPGITNPLGIIPAPPAGSWFDLLFSLLWRSSFIMAVVCLAVRFKRARGDERQQIKWLLFALVFVIVHVTLLRAVLGVWWDLTFPLVFMSPWLAIGSAMLRYRLYDIDIIINRTLVYTMLTALVFGLYALIVGYLGLLFQTSGSLAISLLATGTVAVLFQPLRARVQRGVNRLIYGERDDPYVIVTRLGQRLEATTDPGAVLPTTVETLALALRLPYVAIELEHTARGPVLIESGRHSAPLSPESGSVHSFPLTYQGQLLGSLRVAARPGETDLSAHDQRLLTDVARQIGVAVHAVLLTADLEQARLRAVNEREAARRRLGSDLHDSIGHQLTALARRAELAANLFDRDLAAARAVLAEMTRDCNAAIAHVRQLAHQLHPPDLELFGLVDALRERAQDIVGLVVTFEVPAPLPPLPVAVETAAYYIAQEALSNVQRHAGAQHCHIRITCAGDGASLGSVLPLPSGAVLQLELSDDGRGVPPAGARRAGLGLVSMQQRAAEIGGVCTITARANGGTLVQARLPLVAA